MPNGSQREKDIRERADDAEDDSQALRNITRWRKVAGKRDYTARAFRSGSRPHPESGAHYRGPRRRIEHRDAPSQRGYPG